MRRLLFQGWWPGADSESNRLEALGQFARTLIQPLEPMLLLRKPAVDALEPFQQFRAKLFKPQHALASTPDRHRAKLPPPLVTVSGLP